MNKNIDIKPTIKEMNTIARQLDKKDLEHLIWMGRGILLASATKDGRTES